MYNIKTINDISPVYSQVLDMTEYTVSPECADPDAIIVRSADLHSMEKNPSLLAIGRIKRSSTRETPRNTTAWIQIVSVANETRNAARLPPTNQIDTRLMVI